MRSADLLAVDVVRRMHQCCADIEVPPKGGCMHFGIYNVTSSEPSKPMPSNRIIDLTVAAGSPARRVMGRMQ